ncbi:hypothetical protein DQ04_10721040 [Trypanosoma grayi]|uniref:hypothetical protein n=1 Tax=Trypanosoma grayi TaxID=71804 RepID=UPI0004F4840C|nr:hypothetical protein DQ04_10721040 [Trypanosoma grayi]KEG07159.1 hypothetical protein DQ04_10721040 [Trypanosoma grayi]
MLNVVKRAKLPSGVRNASSIASTCGDTPAATSTPKPPTLMRSLTVASALAATVVVAAAAATSVLNSEKESFALPSNIPDIAKEPVHAGLPLLP